jgi:para-aminobenzoate synthetase component 1
MFKDPKIIRQINDYGKSRTPFLFVFDFLLQKPWLIKANEINPQEILFQCNQIKNFDDNSQSLDNQRLSKDFYFLKTPPAFADYQKAFSIVQKNLEWGNTYLLNLSAPTPIQTNLSLQEIFFQSLAKYKLWFRNEFVCFSPETFVQIRQGQISAYPMKGTIDASIPNAEQIILADLKESAEHYTIVDLLRNDLSQISKNVRVEKFRYIDSVQTQNKTLLQVSSKIVGDLGKDYPAHLGDLLFALLPAGSVSGAPKRKTVELILTAEQSFKINGKPYERDYYTGVFGYFDGENLDAGVMIRFIQALDNQFVFKSGGGITFMSQVSPEYQELLDKVYLPIY